jgi:hypothetical protein
MDVLTGKVVPVKLGFIAVMNRSQQVCAYPCSRLDGSVFPFLP